MATKKSKKASKVETASKEIGAPMSDDSWKCESDARTLKEAAEIMSDPERLKNAHKHHKKVKKAMRSVDDLVNFRNKKFGGEAEMEDED